MISAMLGSDEIIEFYTPIDSSKVRENHYNIQTRTYGEGYTKYYPEDDSMESYLEFTISGVEGKHPRRVSTNYPEGQSINGEWYGYYLENTQNDGIIPLGKLSGDQSATLMMKLISTNEGGKNEVFLKRELFYAFDTELFAQHISKLRGAVNNLQMEKTTYLTMNITAGANQVLYTSIPYERGWIATVDGPRFRFAPATGLSALICPKERTA